MLRLFAATTVILTATLAHAAAELPTITVTADDTVITASARIVIPPGTVITDAAGDGVLKIEAPDIVVEFAPGSVLRGAAPGADPDTYEGCGIRIINQSGVTIRGACLSGFRAGLWATGTPGLVLEDIDASDNRRSRLRSDPYVEAGGDWIRPHENDGNEWLARYGSALYVEDARDVTIRRCKVWHSQNALCLDRVDESRIYDNDFSFNSGWGIAMWRSSRNVLTRNAVDFCVRGYSHGFYNRGQDSAGFLVFEQNNDNVFAENSATHGGDGFFGFAGLEARGERPAPSEGFEYLRRGNNNNLLIANDFSYAPAHGIEMTFSFGNRYIANRLVGNAICGIWAGYSQDTLIAHNTFTANGDMGYGLERGGINIDSGRHNRIIHNTFTDNRCGVHLWWRDLDRAGENPWDRANLTDWEGNLIAANTFTGDTLALHFRGAGLVTVGPNRYERVDRERDADERTTVTAPTADVPAPERPTYPVFGDTRPVGARPQLAGREQIIMTEWGPWDHVSPLVRFTRNTGRTLEFDFYTGDRTPEVTLHGAALALEEVAGAAPAGAIRRRLRVTAADPGLYPFRLVFTAGDYRYEHHGALLATAWDVTTFPLPDEPRELADDWDAAASGSDARRLRVERLELMRMAASAGPTTAVPDGLRLGPQQGLIARTQVELPAGRYRVTAVHSGGLRVFADDARVIDSWRGRWRPRRGTGTFVVSEPRTVTIRVEHSHQRGDAALILDIVPQAEDDD